jgi:hypothetical protein
MSGLLKDVGAVAGLASFLGLALLSLLYFAQARDVRRLRDQASPPPPPGPGGGAAPPRRDCAQRGGGLQAS